MSTMPKHRLSRIVASIFIVFLGVSVFPSPVKSQDDKPTGFAVLTVGGGARAVGLGETMAADGSDPFVIEYNPAGLSRIDRFAISFAHNSYFLDTRGEYLAAAIPLGRWTVGARMGYVGSDGFPSRTGPSENPLGFYDAADGIFQGALAGPVDDRLSVGISAAWVVEHIDLETAQSFVLGVGILYRAHKRLDIGMAFTNVGPPAKFIDREFKLPNLLRLGGRWDLGVADVRVEIVAGDNDNVKWHFGSEYEIDPRLIVRSGIRLGYDTQWFSGGFGARTADQRLGVDYAFAPYSDGLGSTHRFGLTIRP